MKFSDEVNAWYAKNKRCLDWRSTKDPYKIWISEVMLQQTQIKQATPYYRNLIHTFPNVFALAKAPEIEVLKVWQGLGYYSRARNMHTAAKAIVSVHGGSFPKTYDELIKLKGIGPYTASAIASICFGEARPVVDGNVYRVLTRFFGVSTPINSSKGIAEISRIAHSVMDTANIGDYNQAIMEFGALQCKPKSPDCNACPLSTACVAYVTQSVESYPAKLKGKAVRDRFFSYIVFVDSNNCTLLKKRTKKDIWQNLYEFPLLETPQAANEEQLQTTLKALVQDRPYSKIVCCKDAVLHKLTHQNLHVTFWKVFLVDKLEGGISVSELSKFPMPVLIYNFIKNHMS